ncbi:DUF6243 family protein [Streptomyces sp. 8N706]|uniref:DUF6243 family protein n=1 Tax=Streptomyces sp. 8N706 TaxID=3457416 RepID=UPI003FD03E5E
MPRGSAGNMLGVGGTRSNLSRSALRGGGRGGWGAGAGTDPQAQKRELLLRLKAARENPDAAEASVAGGSADADSVADPDSARGAIP